MEEEGWGVTENGEDNQKGEKRKKVLSFFPNDNKNGFKTVECEGMVIKESVLWFDSASKSI